MIITDASFHTEMMKKTVFKITDNFSENAFIKNPSIISHSANTRGFFFFVFFFFLICYMYIKKTTCQLKCGEKIHLRKFYG